MDLLIFVVFMFILLHFVAPKNIESADDKVVIKKKQCPPHEWFWQDIVDQNGVKHGERIVCKKCGPRSDGD